MEKQPGKFVGDTKCTKLPKQLCGLDNCEFVAGEEECHNKTVANTIDVPEENCDLVPQKTCRGVYKLVPYLVPTPECKDIPREVCSFGVKSTRLGEKPIVTKWCYDSSQGENPFRDSGPAPPRERGPAPQRNPQPPRRRPAPRPRPQPPVPRLPTSEDVIGTEGPGLAPVIDDNVIYDYEDAAEDQLPFPAATTPATTPRYLPPVAGTASADIQDDRRGGRTVGSRNRARGNNNNNNEVISAEELRELDQLIADYEERGEESGDFEYEYYYDYDGSGSGSGSGDEYYYDEEDNNGGEERDEEDDDIGDLSFTFDYTNTEEYSDPANYDYSLYDYDDKVNDLGVTATERTGQAGVSTPGLTGSNTARPSQRQRPQQPQRNNVNIPRLQQQRPPLPDNRQQQQQERQQQQQERQQQQQQRQQQQQQQRQQQQQQRQQQQRQQQRQQQQQREPKDDITFHKDVPEEIEDVLDVVHPEKKEGLKVGVAVGTGARKDAEKESLAKVIKHKDKDSKVGKTVIIKNTPEAFKVFGVKNVPKEFFAKSEELKKEGAAKNPVNNNNVQNEDVVNVNEESEIEGVNNESRSENVALNGQFVNQGENSQLERDPKEFSAPQQQGGNGNNGLGSNNDNNAAGVVSVGIAIEETLGEAPPPAQTGPVNPHNPFLFTKSPEKASITRGKPSWADDDGEEHSLQPVQTPVNSRPILTQDPVTGNVGTVRFESSGQVRPLDQRPRQPKTQNVNSFIRNPAVTNAQNFAVPVKPPGPSKEQQVHSQHQQGLINTIRTHNSIIKPSDNNNNNNQVQQQNNFRGRNPFTFPQNANELIQNDPNSVRTSRNPQYQNGANEVGNGGGFTSSAFSPPSQGSYTPSPFSPPPNNGFKPPATLQYGFKPMTTPTRPRPTPQSSRSTQGRFSAPSSLHYGFSPLAQTGSPTARPASTGNYRPQSTNNVNTYSTNFAQNAPRRQNSVKNNNNNSKRKARSMMDIITDMLEPITKPFKNIIKRL